MCAYAPLVRKAPALPSQSRPRRQQCSTRPHTCCTAMSTRCLWTTRRSTTRRDGRCLPRRGTCPQSRPAPRRRATATRPSRGSSTGRTTHTKRSRICSPRAAKSTTGGCPRPAALAGAHPHGFSRNALTLCPRVQPEPPDSPDGCATEQAVALEGAGLPEHHRGRLPGGATLAVHRTSAPKTSLTGGKEAALAVPARRSKVASTCWLAAAVMPQHMVCQGPRAWGVAALLITQVNVLMG